MYADIKIQVSCSNNQSTLGSNSTIFQHINEVGGRKNCSKGQEAKSLDRLRDFLLTVEQFFRPLTQAKGRRMDELLLKVL